MTDSQPPRPHGETAGHYMVTSLPVARAATLAQDVIEAVRGRTLACADTVFVTGADHALQGIVRINDLLANPDRPVGEIMEPRHAAVRAHDDQEAIAMLAIDTGMIAVPVVDDAGRLVGAVPPEALFAILRAEHMEDLQRIAGIAAHEHGPAAALDEPVRRRIARRLPWLVFGLFASVVITLVMVSFEEALAADVTVAFFVPALVYIAGAIGTQAVSVSVRGLSTLNVPIAPLLRDELVIGIGIGAVLGTISALAVQLAFANPALSLAVGLAVLTGGAFSAVVGFGLPWLFKQLGSDPALGSGPICTIIQDVASLLIYFMLASALVL